MRRRRGRRRPSSDRRPSRSRRVFDASLPFGDNVDAQIFFLARLPRAVAAALVGGTLAAAGVVFQGLLRNPLATPYTLGVSAGASLGAMLAITFGAALPFGAASPRPVSLAPSSPSCRLCARARTSAGSPRPCCCSRA